MHQVIAIVNKQFEKQPNEPILQISRNTQNICNQCHKSHYEAFGLAF